MTNHKPYKPRPQFEVVTRNRKGRKMRELWLTDEEFFEVQLFVERMRDERK